jgi:hypothetical protein
MDLPELQSKSKAIESGPRLSQAQQIRERNGGGIKPNALEISRPCGWDSRAPIQWRAHPQRQYSLMEIRWPALMKAWQRQV